jgi:hypothetical protein
VTTKEWLLRGWMIEARIRAAEGKLQALRARAGRVKSSAPKAVPGGGRARAWTEAVDALCDAEAALCREIAELYRVEAEIAAAIDGVQCVRLRVLLKYRYLCYMTWTEIAEIMRYDVRTVTRLHVKALKMIKCP